MADCASAEKDARPRFDPPPRVKGPPKYSTSYTRESLEAAVQDVLRGEALREVIAKFQRDYEHDIPLMTLRDAVSRAKKQGSSGFVKKGRPTSLTGEQEIEGLKHMNKMADHGLTPDKSYVIWYFSNIAAILGIPFPKKPEGKWWRCFKKRHSEWVLKSTQNYERCRACAMDAFAVNRFFDTYEKVLNDPDRQSPGCTYAERPDRVANLDESGIQGQVSQVRGFALKGKRPKRLDNGLGKDTETIVSTACASGTRKPFLMLLLGDRVSSQSPMEHCGDGYSFVKMGKKAYQNQASWPRTLDDLKRKYKTSTTNRFLLLVDGHVSRLSLENVEYAEKLGIDIIIFPGHLTHLIQPEDQVFGKFKQSLRTLNTAFVLRTKGATLTKHQFYGKCARAYEGALTQQLTISAWRACGLSVKPETGAVVPDREKILSKLPKAAVERYDKWVADGGKERDDRAALRDEDDDAPSETTIPSTTTSMGSYSASTCPSSVESINESATPEEEVRRLKELLEEVNTQKHAAETAMHALESLRRTMEYDLNTVPDEPAKKHASGPKRGKTIVQKVSGLLLTSESVKNMIRFTEMKPIREYFFKRWKQGVAEQKRERRNEEDRLAKARRKEERLRLKEQKDLAKAAALRQKTCASRRKATKRAAEAAASPPKKQPKTTPPSPGSPPSPWTATVRAAGGVRT